MALQLAHTRRFSVLKQNWHALGTKCRRLFPRPYRASSSLVSSAGAGSPMLSWFLESIRTRLLLLRLLRVDRDGHKGDSLVGHYVSARIDCVPWCDGEGENAVPDTKHALYIPRRSRKEVVDARCVHVCESVQAPREVCGSLTAESRR